MAKKKKKFTFAMQRSIEHLEKNGWQWSIVEKYLPPRGNMKHGILIDVWGFGDLLACFPERRFPGTSGEKVIPGRIALIQTFPISEWDRHMVKMQEPKIKERADAWKRSKGLIFMQGWGLRKPKGGYQGDRVWTLREKVL